MLPMHIICLSTLLLCGHIISGFTGPRVAGPSLGWQQSLAHSAACGVVWLWARSHALLVAACNKREQEPRSDLR